MKFRMENLSGVWSAAPTPFTEQMKIDTVAAERMVEHHVRLGIRGLFLAGTNGEGPWMIEGLKHTLVKVVARCVKGRIPVAVQVTDNSSFRILDNIEAAKKDGADIAVIAPPYFLDDVTPKNIANLYLKTIRTSPLPIGIYDLGSLVPVFVPNSVLKEIYAEKNVILVKDSSLRPQRREIALAAKRRRPELCLLNGWEFNCVEYLKAGYDGLLLGGGVFNGYLACKIFEAVKAGNLSLAEQLQRRMNRIMYAVYGGKKLKCWIAGEKKLLVDMGIFRTWKSCLNYPLTDHCQKAIRKVLEKESDVLMPDKESER